jgi:hypothetical protein
VKKKKHLKQNFLAKVSDEKGLRAEGTEDSVWNEEEELRADGMKRFSD